MGLQFQCAKEDAMRAEERFETSKGANATAVDDVACSQFIAIDAGSWRSVIESMLELVCLCDARGTVTFLNPALQRLTWRSVVPGLPLQEHALAYGIYLPGGGALCEEHDLPLQRAALTGESQRNVELILRRPDGAERLTIWNAAPLRDEQGNLIGAVAVGRDATDEHALAQAREDWLAAAAHDLRNPMAGLLGHVQLARRTLTAYGVAQASLPAVAAPGSSAPAAPSAAGTAGKQVDAKRGRGDQRLEDMLARLRRNVEVAEASAREVVRRMNTLLDASAAAAGGLTLRVEAGGVDLTALLRQAVMDAAVTTTRHTLAVEAPRRAIIVPGDRERVRQALDNLLGNAVKYSPDGGRIVVRLEMATTLPVVSLHGPTAGIETGIEAVPHAQGAHEVSTSGAPEPDGEMGAGPAWALVRIADEGLGIPASDVPHVFERYRRATGRAGRVRDRRGAWWAPVGGAHRRRARSDAHYSAAGGVGRR
jgi:signal transduction histidine kinase